MDGPSVQQLFFLQIKDSMPPHLSLVDSIAELLNISNDSAYGRIRCEKPISFEEIKKLSLHFHISLDQFLHLQSDSLLFSGRIERPSEHYFEEYLENLLRNFTYLNGFDQRHLYFLTKDIPWIYFFQIPELSAFKIFVWMRSILHDESLKNKKLSLQDRYFPEYAETGKKIVEQYNKIPTSEIWNLESISITLQQIEYYLDCGAFKSTKDALIIYEKLEELINHIERQAEHGRKFLITDQPSDQCPAFNMYYNELALGDNTVLADLGKTKITFLNHSTIEYIFTRDEKFCNQMHQTISNLISKSTQISTVGEKNRSHFFGFLTAKIPHQIATGSSAK
jgi:hypothetical protein